MPLTPEELAELQQLEREFGDYTTPSNGLTPSEQMELESLERELGLGGMGGGVDARDSVPWLDVLGDLPTQAKDNFFSGVFGSLEAANRISKLPSTPQQDFRDRQIPFIGSVLPYAKRGLKAATDFLIPDDIGLDVAREQAQREIAERQQNYTLPQRVASNAFGSMVEFAPSIIAGVATGTGALLPTVYGTQRFASDKFLDYANDGMDEEKALQYATLQAIPQAVLERIGFGKVFKPGRSGFNKVAESVITEGTTEALQEVSEDIGDALLTDEEFNFGDTARKAGESFLTGAVAGGGFSGIESGSRKLKEIKLNKKINEINNELDAREVKAEVVKELEQPSELPVLREGETIEVDLEYDQNLPADTQNVAPPIDPNLPSTEQAVVFEDTVETKFDKAERKLKQYGTARQGFSEQTFQAKERSEGVQDATRYQVEGVVKEYKKTLNKITEEYKLDFEKTDRVIGAALKGEISMDQVPKELQGITEVMRTQVDQLTLELIRSGALEGKGSEKAIEQLGTYINRSYERFENFDKWQKELLSPKKSKEVKAKIHEFQRFLEKDSRQREGESVTDYAKRLNVPRLEGETDQQLSARIRQDYSKIVNDIYQSYIYDNGDVLDSLFKNHTKFKDNSILKKRNEAIPVEVRNFWGERKSGGMSYFNSAMKMTNLLASHKFLKDVAEIGRTEGFLFDNQHEAPSGFVQIAGEDSKALSPLNGKYVSREFKEALELYFKPENQNAILNSIYKINSWSKMSKTVLNPLTQVRNNLANPSLLLKNGNLFYSLTNLDQGAAAFKQLLPESVGNAIFKDPKQLDNVVTELIELGVLNKGATGQEFKEMMQDGFKSLDESGTFLENFSNKKSVKKGVEKGFGAVQKLYQFGDDFYKVLNYHAEYSKYRKAIPQDQATDAEIKRLAAEITRDTMPDYSRVPRAVQALRKTVVLAPFVAFSSEMIRNNYHSIKLIRKELKSDNPGIRAIGARRAVGYVLSHSVHVAAYYALRAAFGVDEEEAKATNSFVSSWDKFSLNLPMGVTPEGVLRYANITYVDPQAFLKQGVLALARTDEDDPAWKYVTNSLGELLSGFVGEGVLTSAIGDIIYNKDNFGKEIYSEDESSNDKVLKSLDYFWDRVKPGLLNEIDRYERIDKRDKFAGRKSTALEKTLYPMATGTRVTEKNLPDHLGYAASEFNESERNTSKIFTRIAKDDRRDYSVEELYEAITKSAERRQVAIDNFRKKVNDGYKLGMGYDLTKESVSRGDLSGKKFDKIMLGELDGFYVTEPTLKTMKEIPGRYEKFTTAYAMYLYDQEQKNLEK